jgi:hypothetical protein
MYCPSCGSEERQRSQFCRACGTDLRAVRTTLETPDAITASAVSAREQISRVMTEKIAQLESADDLKEVAEDVLPQIEKFLESPEERRLRRVRAGVIVASVGLGATVITFFMAMMKSDMFPFLGLGLITFLIGLGLIINGMVFTVPPKEIPNRLSMPMGHQPLEQLNEAPIPNSSVGRPLSGGSVTEHTTQHLGHKQPL